jgi:flagellar motor switch protein FliN/FliY
MNIEEILHLGPGSVVELDKLAGEPVDVLVNDKMIARGEVVVLDDRFGVRITDVLPPVQRINSLK